MIEPPLAFPAPTLREWILPAILFVATFASTSFAGLLYAGYGDGRFFATGLAAPRAFYETVDAASSVGWDENP